MNHFQPDQSLILNTAESEIEFISKSPKQSKLSKQDLKSKLALAKNQTKLSSSNSINSSLIFPIKSPNQKEYAQPTQSYPRRFKKRKSTQNIRINLSSQGNGSPLMLAPVNTEESLELKQFNTEEGENKGSITPNLFKEYKYRKADHFEFLKENSEIMACEIENLDFSTLSEVQIKAEPNLSYHISLNSIITPPNKTKPSSKYSQKEKNPKRLVLSKTQYGISSYQLNPV